MTTPMSEPTTKEDYPIYRGRAVGTPKQVARLTGMTTAHVYWAIKMKPELTPMVGEHLVDVEGYLDFVESKKAKRKVTNER